MPLCSRPGDPAVTLWGLRPHTPSPLGSLALARSAGLIACAHAQAIRPTSNGLARSGWTGIRRAVTPYEPATLGVTSPS